MAEGKVQYRLDKKFEKFTGLLNNVYPVRDGIAEVPVGSEKKAGRILETHYGATKVVPEVKKEEAKK